MSVTTSSSKARDRRRTRVAVMAVTGEPVFRETTLPGGVLTRVAASHLRVGTVEFAAATGAPDALRTLADYTMQRHYLS